MAPASREHRKREVSKGDASREVTKGSEDWAPEVKTAGTWGNIRTSLWRSLEFAPWR